MKTVVELLVWIALCIPLAWELVNDWHGDFNKKRDVYIRVSLGVLAASASHLTVGHQLLTAFFLSMAIHFFIFDYVIAWRYLSKGIVEGRGLHWFSYLGKKGTIDNISYWKRMKPGWRLVVRFATLATAITLYYAY